MGEELTIPPVDSETATHRSAGALFARRAEELIPRGVGILFLYAGARKGWNGSNTHSVFAFDGVPQPLIVPLTHVVWVGEIALGLLLLVGIAKRRAIVVTILMLFVYSVQLAYLIAAQDPPSCACLNLDAIVKRFASAKQAMLLGLVRNAMLAAGLEWVRLRRIARQLSQASSPSTGQNEEDG